jgi:serine O-acetyltransferase
VDWIPRDLGQLKATVAADWARPENETPAQRLVLLVWRLGQYLHARRRRGIAYYVWRAADLVYLRAVLGADLSPTANIGPGLALPHVARGVAIGDTVTVGPNSMIYQRATIGNDAGGGGPWVGDNVSVGVGACVLGQVSVGTGARISPNAVVTSDVPAHAVAFGVPARILRMESDEATGAGEPGASAPERERTPANDGRPVREQRQVV